MTEQDRQEFGVLRQYLVSAMTLSATLLGLSGLLFLSDDPHNSIDVFKVAVKYFIFAIVAGGITMYVDIGLTMTMRFLGPGGRNFRFFYAFGVFVTTVFFLFGAIQLGRFVTKNAESLLASSLSFG